MTLAVAFRGIEAIPVETQVRLMPGLPNFTIVGLADKVVAESRERIRVAINSMGLSFPLKRIIVNLSPADLTKEGSHYDLPIAIGLLIEMGVISAEDIRGALIMGELSLDGDIIGVTGILPAAALAKQMERPLVCPWHNASEAMLIDELNLMAPQNLLQFINFLKKRHNLPVAERIIPSTHTQYSDFLNKVKGHFFAKRAAEIAVAGGHNMLMIGPPGSGKSMLARGMADLLPPMSPHEAITTNMIRSVAGEVTNGFSLTRPYRAPHHSCSTAAMIGGGKRVKPGEVSLAHNGVLFLDELPEFSGATLEALRQPLEARSVLIARAESHVTYPANFQLVAAMNPCKCGYAGTVNAMCANRTKCVTNYVNRISGPMLDRIDLFIGMGSVDIFKYTDSTGDIDDLDEVRARIAGARAMQHERYRYDDITLNSETSWDLVQKHSLPDIEGISIIKNVANKRNLSTRAINKIFQVARTIADLASSQYVLRAHVAEAIVVCNRDILFI